MNIAAHLPADAPAPRCSTRFDPRVRFLVNVELPRWIDNARGMDCDDVAFVLTEQRELLIEGVATVEEVRADIERAKAALTLELLHGED